MNTREVKLILKKRLPDILMGAGIGLSILATYVSGKEGEEFASLSSYYKNAIAQIHKDKDEGKYIGLKSAYKHDLSREYKKYFKSYLKHHWKSIMLETGSATAIIFSHKIEKKREAVALGAAAAIKKSFDIYREGVKETDGGTDLDERLMAGSREVYETSEFDETGKGSRKRKTKRVINRDYMCDDMSFIFGPYKADGSPNPKWNPNMDDNYSYVEAMEDYFSNMADTKPVIFLNQVIPYFDDSFEALTEAGQELGKCFSMRNPQEPDVRFVAKDYAIRCPNDPSKFVDCLLIQTNFDNMVSQYLN